MTRGVYKWCPRGCGKKVIFYKWTVNRENIYKCIQCGTAYPKYKLKVINNLK